MKNQNFGDNRDLLKLDLVYQIVKSNLVDNFTYIPMLTENIAQPEEPHVCRPEASGGTGNKALLEFLDKSIINEQRDIGQLEDFFHQHELKVTVYGKNKIFTHAGRKAYFEGIRPELLKNSLILVDPDKGLDDLDTILFFLTKNKFLQNLLLNFLKGYTEQYFKKAEG